MTGSTDGTGLARRRAQELVARMTIDEKLSLVHGTGGFSTTDDPPATAGNFGYTARSRASGSRPSSSAAPTAASATRG